MLTQLVHEVYEGCHVHGKRELQSREAVLVDLVDGTLIVRCEGVAYGSAQWEQLTRLVGERACLGTEAKDRQIQHIPVSV